MTERSASVRSIQALEDFKAVLCNFDQEARDALTAVELEIRRTVDWIGDDQYKYWQVEARRREETVLHAKADLDRCRIAATFGRPPDCTDQKKALQKAKARLVEAEEKIEAVKRWRRQLEQEVADFQGPSQQLSSMLAVDVPRAAAELQRMILALESYVAVSHGSASAPQTRGATAAPTDALSPTDPAPTPEDVDRSAESDASSEGGP